MLDTSSPEHILYLFFLPLLAILVGGLIVWWFTTIERADLRTEHQQDQRRQYALDYLQAIDNYVLAALHDNDTIQRQFLAKQVLNLSAILQVDEFPATQRIIDRVEQCHRTHYGIGYAEVEQYFNGLRSQLLPLLNPQFEAKVSARPYTKAQLKAPAATPLANSDEASATPLTSPAKEPVTMAKQALPINPSAVSYTPRKRAPSRKPPPMTSI